MATVEAIAHARRLHTSAREAHREEARQRRAAKRYYDALKDWCRIHGITVQEYDPRILKDGDRSHGPSEDTVTR